MLVRFLGLLFLAISVSCSGDTQFPKLTYEKLDFSEVERILILGNSITISRPDPELGWSGNWGMAASSRQTDYVHLLEVEFRNVKETMELEYHPVVGFEREFWNFDLENLSFLLEYEADLIIINLGENVEESDASKHLFGDHLADLIKFLDNGKNLEIVCVDSFWNKAIVNNQIRDLCIDEEYRFVHISDLGDNDKFKALNEFSNRSVAAHPSDLGMQQISERIMEALGL